jgi:DNA-binding beta-propeller fold protein YncE
LPLADHLSRAIGSAVADGRLGRSAVAPLIATILALVIFCSTPSVHAQKKAAADLSRTPTQSVWPLPPDEPRVRYVATYAGADDLGAARKSRTLSLKEALLGRSQASPQQQNPNGFVKPFGVAVDGFGRIIVADSVQASVVVMDPARRQFLPMSEYSDHAAFRAPVGLAVDAANNIYVGDNGLNRILVFGPDLAFRMTIGGGDEMLAPSGLAVDQDRGRLYAIDSRKHALLVYDLATGKLQGRVGKRGSEEGEFNMPTAVAVGPDGRVYVTDTMNYRVEVFGPDLRFLWSFGSLGVRPGQFRRPKGIAVDSENVVYVVDSDYNNFQMFTAQGQPLMWVGEMGRRPGQMLLPAGIAVDRPHRRIIVCEQYNKRVQVFERVGPAGK